MLHVVSPNDMLLDISVSQEEFEDTNEVIRIRISKKNRQHNGQKKKYKQNLQNTTQKTKRSSIQ